MNQNRVKSIDALRGFALLGILIINMFHFQYSAENINVLSMYPNFNEALYYGIRIVVQGSFLTIFAFLFGFSIMQFHYNRARKSLSSKMPLFRRGLALLIIGLIHYVFIWPGDILAPYGFLIIVVLFFVSASEKTLKILMYVFLPVYFFINYLMRLGADLPITGQSQLKDNVIYTTASYSEALNHCLLFGIGTDSTQFVGNIVSHLFMTVMTTPLVLIVFALYGMYVSKRQLMNVKKFEAVSIKRWLPITILGIGLKCGLLLGGLLGPLLLTIGSLLTTYGYIHMFLTLYDKGLPEKVKQCFEYVGKMTISNYIGQSVVLTLLFANYGLGLSGKLGIAWGLVISITLFVIQALCSYYIIKRFKQGPIEFLLRKFIYLGDKKVNKQKSTPVAG